MTLCEHIHERRMPQRPLVQRTTRYTPRWCSVGASARAKHGSPKIEILEFQPGKYLISLTPAGAAQIVYCGPESG